jgi:DNA replication protein DnaC
MDYRSPRGLDKALLTSLATCQWVRERRNVLITGPTGVGKTWVACALGHQACRAGFTTLYLRLPRLLQELPITKGDGRYPKLMTTLAKIELLILDDWGLAALSRATIVTSQLPVEHWHEALGDPTLADAILDRLVHNAYKLPLRGESMRKRQAKEPTHIGGSCD